MAAVQQQLRAHSRGGGGGTARSTRVDANTARPLQQPPASSAHSVQAPPSSLALFLSNLKLLDLDLLPDWPGLSTETFAAAGAGASGQKRRVRAVEWALFQLFALWDPEETANVSSTLTIATRSQPDSLVETQALLPAPRPGSVHQPPRRVSPSPRTGQEEWRPWPGCRPPKDHA
jgi:hypothetical protein